MQKPKLLSLFGYSIPLVIFLVTAVFLWYGLDRDPRYLPSPLINKPIPAFHLLSLQNIKQPLNEKIFLGHITLLNVWAPWCASCKEEHSVLMKIAKTKKLVLYGLNYKDKRASALEWLAHDGNPYHEVLFDDQGKLGLDLGVYGTPETYLIDSKGIIRYKYIGPITQAVWDEVILPEVERLI
jgi:cytochrome c biogenesis protein CcmG/thiol:disulfide interchange protein DsbE